MIVLSTALIVTKVFAIVLVSVLVLSFVLDYALRSRAVAGGDVAVSAESGTANNHTLIVYFPGILAGGRSSSVDLIDTWRSHGDRVLMVEYGRERFDGRVIVDGVVRRIRRENALTPFRTIKFIGSSMGGLLAYDVIRQLHLGKSVSIGFYPIDAPTSSSDFQPPNHLVAPLLRVLPFGPIWDKLNLVSLMFVPPKEANIEAGVDRAELARRVEQGKSYPLSFWRDELVFIMNHGAPKPGSLEGLVDDEVYVRSTRDNDTVRAQAYGVWALTKSEVTRMEVDSTHVGFAERPDTWRQAFEQLLDRRV